MNNDSKNILAKHKKPLKIIISITILLTIISTGLILNNPSSNTNITSMATAQTVSTITKTVDMKPTWRITGCKSKKTKVYTTLKTKRTKKKKLIAITFDDGPAQITNSFVEYFKKQKIKATFFMVGQNISKEKKMILNKILKNGFEIGNHSYTHTNLSHLNYAGVKSELDRTQQKIRELTQFTPCVFRPPYGAYNSTTTQVGKDLGLANIMWAVDPNDWKTRTTQQALTNTVVNNTSSGSIILSHDGGGDRHKTLNAYKTIIPKLKKKGYKFVTVSQLLKFKPIIKKCTKHVCPLTKKPK